MQEGDPDGQDRGGHGQGVGVLHRRVHQLQRCPAARQARPGQPPGGVRRGAAHINGIEGFWSFAKRLYRHVHGVDSGNFPLYLAEYEFRYNHRGEHLMDLLYDRMIRPTIPTQTVP
ncbi:MAG: transposase [Gemmataceae bacterium]